MNASQRIKRSHRIACAKWNWEDTKDGPVRRLVGFSEPLRVYARKLAKKGSPDQQRLATEWLGNKGVK